MKKRRKFLSALGAGSLTLLSGCSTIRSKLRSNNPLRSDELRLEIFWTPTSDTAYRFRLGSFNGDVAFIKTSNIEGEVRLSEDIEDNCSRDDCIYEYTEVDDEVGITFSEGASGYISFFGAIYPDESEPQVKELGRFYLDEEEFEYLDD